MTNIWKEEKEVRTGIGKDETTTRGGCYRYKSMYYCTSGCAGETGGAPLTRGLSFDTAPVHHLAIQERREKDNNYCMLEWRFVFYYL